MLSLLYVGNPAHRPGFGGRLDRDRQLFVTMLSAIATTMAQYPPSSPTELSYTQLVKLAPQMSQRRKTDSGAAGTSSSLQTPAAALASVPAKPNAPRLAPPASINVPSMFHPNASDELHHQTPARTSQFLTATAPMSAPLQNETRSNMIPQQQRRSQNLNDSGYYYPMPMDDRVSSLATKLQAMQTIPASSDLHHSQQQQQQRSNDRLNEIHQFIDTLKNMQQAVSRTADEQQRVKKSRALNALLSMFEGIIDDQSHTMERVVLHTDPTLELSIKQLEQQIQQLEGENQHLQIRCQEKDVQLHHMNDELQYSHRELQRLADTNQQLKIEVMQTHEQCHQEVKRALEAESVANEAEDVRNGLLANHARLSEENVDMQREMENVKSENNKMVTEFEFCQQEITHLQTQCGELSQQLQRKGTDMVELEKAIVDLNDQLAAQRNVLQSTNADRQRLQDELHTAQRNSTAASEQLMKLRNQFSLVRRENDSKRHHQLTQESEYNFVRTKLQEEQHRRRELERSMLHQLPLSRCEEDNSMAAAAAMDELRRIASANAELKKKVEELNVQTRCSSRPESSAINYRFDKDDASLASRVVSSIASGKGQWEPNVDELNSRSGFLSNVSKKRSEVCEMDEFSANEVDSVARGHLRNDTSMRARTQHSKPAEPTTENGHPNLMDYFYSQINRAE